jgi:NADPH:quinone reductase-like Zn-dependent oxidoreductase
MKAIVYYRYGSPDVLKCEEIEKPTPAEDEVLIKVRAASVNPYDWHFMRGTPYFVRIPAGLLKPKDRRLGVDVAGWVEAVGRSVTKFKPGDEVFGVSRGAFAEYACASESALVMKPANVTFEQAASVPIAALTALQGLRDKGQIQPGQKVLINGAAGGVGTFAVQIAKSFGADVTGVCSTRNVEMVRSIGADRVIDYAQQDFTSSGQLYDLIFDCVGNHLFSACRRVLNPKGTYIAVGGPSGRWMIGPLARLITALVLSRFASQKLVMVLAKPNKEDLTIMHHLMKARKVTPVIDKRYKLSEVPEAIRYLEEGHARGKVVITLE